MPDSDYAAGIPKGQRLKLDNTYWFSKLVLESDVEFGDDGPCSVRLDKRILLPACGFKVGSHNHRTHRFTHSFGPRPLRGRR